MTDTAYASMNDLMARIGFLLLRWGWLENSERDKKQSLSALAEAPELKEARRIRNLVAHGIFRASADPRTKAEPFISCIAQNGARHDISYTELSNAITAIERYLGNVCPPSVG